MTAWTWRSLAASILALSPFIGSAATQDIPPFCDTDDPARLIACPQACRPACENVQFSTRSIEISDVCGDVLLEAMQGTPDADFCTAEDVETDLVLAADWHARIKQSCMSSHPPVTDSPIPLLSEIPACAVTLGNLRCRVDGISARTESFATLVSEFEPLQFDENMCDLNNVDVENAYQHTSQLENPLTILKTSLEAEQDCQRQVEAWINGQACQEGDRDCQIDVTKDVALTLVEKQLQPSIEKATAIPTILRRVEETRKRIETGYGLYTFACN